jgi:hypothetical protein
MAGGGVVDSIVSKRVAPPFQSPDGSALALELSPSGRLAGAHGVGKDGVARRFWTDPPGVHTTVYFQEGHQPALKITLAVDEPFVRLRAEVGSRSLDHAIDCTNAPGIYGFIVTDVVSDQTGELARSVGAISYAQIAQHFRYHVVVAFPGCEPAVSFFQSVLVQAIQDLTAQARAAAATADPAAQLTAMFDWAKAGKIGKAIGWGVAGLAVAVLTGGTGLVLAGSFLAGFDASLADTVISDLTSSSQPTGGSTSQSPAAQSSAPAGGAREEQQKAIKKP